MAVQAQELLRLVTTDWTPSTVEGSNEEKSRKESSYQRL